MVEDSIGESKSGMLYLERLMFINGYQSSWSSDDLQHRTPTSSLTWIQAASPDFPQNDPNPMLWMLKQPLSDYNNIVTRFLAVLLLRILFVPMNTNTLNHLSTSQCLMTTMTTNPSFEAFEDGLSISMISHVPLGSQAFGLIALLDPKSMNSYLLIFGIGDCRVIVMSQTLASCSFSVLILVFHIE
ncbi:PREDICTED: uncharacterized protein LOC109129987 [Camelina sativa]|uniref:Uncharacterized protein LOC109129987 n=1 Tax=Camelina sativa TaxID=90675 RepID=A0ABM1R6G6_CAMSA|nr:PREDICTED: uncharacterized protein LOC109129987 [Camelina sativa]